MPGARARPDRAVAVVGLGAVGLAVARALDAGVEGLRLAAVSSRDLQRAAGQVADFRNPPKVGGLEQVVEEADVVVECAPAAAFRAIAEPALRRGRTLVTVSCGALLAHWDLVDVARASGGRIVVPTGALVGLDAVQAAALGDIESVRIVTTKPPGGLAGAPYLVEHGIDLTGLDAPRRVFEGSAAEGARHFPANVNVAAALGMAGIGAERTRLEIWADPGIDRNRHRVLVEADSARLELTIENVPSSANPRTGRIVSQSVLAALRKLVSPLVIGT